LSDTILLKDEIMGSNRSGVRRVEKLKRTKKERERLAKKAAAAGQTKAAGKA
jgi:hypothetical protein